jgi:hypothetical protein
MKVAVRGVQPFGAQRLKEPTRWILRLAEQQHRRYPLAEKSASDVTHKPPTQSEPLVLAQQIDLAQLASKVSRCVIVERSFCKPDQLAARPFDNKTKPATIRHPECVAPLTFAEFVVRTVWPASMRGIPGLDMKTGQCGYVGGCSFSYDKSLA